MRRLAEVALLVSLAGATGCYRYASVAPGELSVGQSVRLQLSAVAVDRLRRGPGTQANLLDEFSVTGKMARVGAESLTVAVAGSALDASTRSQPRLQELLLMRSDVQHSEMRVLDRSRTRWTAVALGLATAAGAAYAIRRGGRATGTTPVVGGPNEVRFPLAVRWQVP